MGRGIHHGSRVPFSIQRPKNRGVVIALLAILLAVLLAVAQSHPNVSIIVSDDHGYADVGWASPDIQTPNIQRIATEGARLRSPRRPRIRHRADIIASDDRLDKSVGAIPGEEDLVVIGHPEGREIHNEVVFVGKAQFDCGEAR